MAVRGRRLIRLEGPEGTRVGVVEPSAQTTVVELSGADVAALSAQPSRPAASPTARSSRPTSTRIRGVSGSANARAAVRQACECEAPMKA